jgi:hypothetical protein
MTKQYSILVIALLLSLFMAIAGAQELVRQYYSGIYSVNVSCTTMQGTLTLSDEAYSIYLACDSNSAGDAYVAFGTYTNGQINSRTVLTDETGGDTIKIPKGTFIRANVRCKNIYHKSDSTADLRVVSLHNRQRY